MYIYIYIIASKSFPDDIHVRRTLRCAHELSAQGSRASYYIPSMAMLHLMVMALVVMRTSIIQQEVYIHTCMHTTYIHTPYVYAWLSAQASYSSYYMRRVVMVKVLAMAMVCA